MIDPRASSPERIVPPAPLPCVSRRALKRVKNPLPVPTECPCCGGEVRLVNNSEIYNGRSFGEWPYMYLCKPCDAYVGLHPATDIPLGTMATKVGREARKSSKQMFHKLMEIKGFARTQMYEWLAERMKIPVGECHFGWFNEEQSATAEAICVIELRTYF